MTPRPSRTIAGTARWARRISSGADPAPAWQALVDRYEADANDVEALFDMSIMLRLTGQVEAADRLQGEALAHRTTFTCRHGTGEGLQVLVFVTGADVLSNAPIDFLFEQTDATLHYLHVDAADDWEAPEHDVAFVAIGQAAANAPALARLAEALPHWRKPVMNWQCERILELTRTGVSARFADAPAVQAPAQAVVSRAEVQARRAAGSPLTYPLLIRPVETHGGKGLERIDGPEAIDRYLADHADDVFHVGPFIDFSSADGLYRKPRITFIDGVAYPAHLAISSHWLVHYISSGMVESAEKRAEEAAWMARFDTEYAVRHAEALKTIAERIGVDYFSIDCAETRDGRFLLFEADVASIVHALDPVDLFPYKQPAMRRLFAAFHRALEKRVRAG